MNKWIALACVTFGILLVGKAETLEQWTYDGVPDGPLSSAVSLTGTGNSFGTGISWLKISSSEMLIAAPTNDYSEGISSPDYAGKSTGVVTLSYDIPFAKFFPNPAGYGEFSLGLRSGTANDCFVTFQYDSINYYLSVTDADGTYRSASILDNAILNDLKITQIYNLDDSGTAGSFRIFYTLGGGPEIELFEESLTLHSGFSLDKFIFEVPLTGTSWKSLNVINVDNLILDSPEKSLTFLQEEIVFADNGDGDKGVIPNTPNITFEPGDILQITTTNKNGLISVNDVTTSLSANGFNITPLSPVNFASLAAGEIYTATYRVEILDGATNGLNTFTVTNQIGSGPTATAFSASF